MPHPEQSCPPHPERACEPLMGSEDGLALWQSLLEWAKAVA
jgi:phosphoribosylformylglycinamidine (FGAM) synthase-like amidotransferase family enzyme